MRSTRSVFRDLQLGNNRLRVLTVPIVAAGTDRLIGRIQLGTPLTCIGNNPKGIGQCAPDRSWALDAGRWYRWLVRHQSRTHAP